MSIDKSGTWWVGSDPQDLCEYLIAYGADNAVVSDFRLAKCSKCSSQVFSLAADDNEGCAQRVCADCSTSHFICDSEEYWEDASPEEWVCLCGSREANIGVGFSLYEDGEIRWLYVGERCAVCGILGCFAGWKVAYSPSRPLMENV